MKSNIEWLFNEKDVSIVFIFQEASGLDNNRLSFVLVLFYLKVLYGYHLFSLAKDERTVTIATKE